MGIIRSKGLLKMVYKKFNHTGTKPGPETRILGPKMALKALFKKKQPKKGSNCG